MKAHSCLLYVALITVLSFSAFAQTNEFGLDVRRLSPRATVVYGDPWNNAILALASTKGIVVIDSSWSKTIALGFREAIATEFKRNDFAALIDSHEHTDHFGGNAAFADLPIYSHESTRLEIIKLQADPKALAKMREFSAAAEIAKMRDYYQKNYPPFLDTAAYRGAVKCYEAMDHDFHAEPNAPLPTVTFDKSLTLHMGNLTLRLVYFGGFHSVGDTIVIIPEENLVMLGQLFFLNRIPIANSRLDDTTPAMVDNWLVVLRQLLKETNEDTRFIACSQRDIIKRAQVEQFLNYLETMWIGVRSAKAEGKTLEQARAALPLKNFPAYAKLSNDAFVGSEWEIRDIQSHNVDFFWKLLSR